ncbi:MmgE/PrpD family protein [Nocardia iowensis]|uniref:MmgE/PrpD family protein n=1 Tax=Nocardia iowensis TaxID=204891 RepID=A0ABX8RVT6_NOCIO|nr:MmgE/PrpD family protein [Nocardia iowensis]QXN92987.1 MmgE/PrpD family protein [Nocardia iowensis]
MSVAETFAQWAVALQSAEIPTPVRRAAAHHVLDGLGCAAAALTEEQPVLTVARELGGPAEATILGTGERIGAPAAALAGAVLVHALDFDDTHTGGLVHATAPVLPVAFAVGEQTGATGAEVLTAMVVGYETICRLAAAVPHGFHARGFHATSVCGVFAAALVAARLYRLSPTRTAHALGIAGSQAGGLLEFLTDGADTKQLHPGFAAHAGILAARFAAAGVTGPRAVFEGEYGLYRALLGREGIDSSLGLGQRWETTRITVKPYPACQVLHAALDAARTADVDAERIESVVADVHPDAVPIVCGPEKARPRTAYAAKFSLPWSVAAMLLDGRVTIDTYRQVNRTDIADLAARVTHRVVDADGVVAEQPGRLRIRLRDGTDLVASVPGSRGAPGDPALDNLVRDKAIGNGLSPAAVGTILAFAEQENLHPLLKELAQ